MKPLTLDIKTDYTTRYELKTFVVRDSSNPDKRPPKGSPARSSEDVVRLARAVYADLDADKEHFVLFTLTNKNRINGFKVVSTGSLTASLVHPREVWTAALRLGIENQPPAAVIFVHNHPSGDPTPSPEDLEITRRLKETGDLFGIRVLDHVVLGDNRHYSFSDHGIL